MESSLHTIQGQLPPKSLQDFQLAFGDYLRSQLHEEDNPIPKRIGQLYQELIFNNLKGFINQCFPVCQTVMTAEQWKTLTLKFFQQGELTSPYFTEINKHFVDFLYELTEENKLALNVPNYMPDLAHYEWVELMLDIYPNENVGNVLYSHEGKSIVLNPDMQNLHYPWAVHHISANTKPTEQTDTFLLVYRTPEHKIAFMETNALTHLLMDFMQQNSSAENTVNATDKDTDDSADKQKSDTAMFANVTALLTAFFESMEINVEDQPNMLGFGKDLLNQLHEKNVLLMV